MTSLPWGPLWGPVIFMIVDEDISDACQQQANCMSPCVVTNSLLCAV